MKKRLLSVIMTAFLFLAAVPAAEHVSALSGDSAPFSCRIAAEGAEAVIYPQNVNGTMYLYLPASADTAALKLNYTGKGLRLQTDKGSIAVGSGRTCDLSAILKGDPAEAPQTLQYQGDAGSGACVVMQSRSIPALFLESRDPAKDRQWVEENKSNKADGSMIMLDAESNVIYSNALKQIKGRGNFTWTQPKKPYQIKLDKKADLMETGDPEEAAKTWVLLANYIDRGLMQNALYYNMAEGLGLEYSPHCRPVDLYYDGEYRGSYLLSEKTEIGSARVAINDLQEDLEKANPEIEDWDALSVEEGRTPFGTQCQYVKGIRSPDSLKGGYLLEMDYMNRAQEEKTNFQTKNDFWFACKSPEYLGKDGVDYISSLYQDFEDTLFNGGTHPVTGAPLSDFMDLESMAKVYLIEELSMDVDIFSSSCYFYKPEGEEKFYAGPVWDFDATFFNSNVSVPYDVFAAGNTYFGEKLLQVPAFRDAVRRIILEQMDPVIMERVLKEDASGKTLSLRGMFEQLRASWRMDRSLWYPEEPESAYDGYRDRLVAMIGERYAWMRETLLQEDFTPERIFFDVPEDSWYRDSVLRATENGWIRGVSIFEFDPEGLFTRAAAVTILYRMYGELASEDGSSFSDVKQGDWYSRAIGWAAEKGIVQGYPDGSFRPNEPLTREQQAVLIFRLAGGKSPSSLNVGVWNDWEQTSDWARPALAWCISRGILRGVDAHHIQPSGITTRCQGTTMFVRLADIFEVPEK